MDGRPNRSEAAPATSWLARLLSAIVALLRCITIRRREKSLHLCETLSLGDKRVLAIVELEGRRFFIGATSQSITLLDRLEPAQALPPRHEPSPELHLSHGVH